MKIVYPLFAIATSCLILSSCGLPMALVRTASDLPGSTIEAVNRGIRNIPPETIEGVNDTVNSLRDAAR